MDAEPEIAERALLRHPSSFESDTPVPGWKRAPGSAPCRSVARAAREPLEWLIRSFTSRLRATALSATGIPRNGGRQRDEQAATIGAESYSSGATLGRDTLAMMKHDQTMFFYCVPDELGAQAHFWNGESGLLCRPPKGTVAVERARCPRHLVEAEKAVGRARRR